jgi:hypothetical protein
LIAKVPYQKRFGMCFAVSFLLRIRRIAACQVRLHEKRFNHKYDEVDEYVGSEIDDDVGNEAA